MTRRRVLLLVGAALLVLLGVLLGNMLEAWLDARAAAGAIL